ncbi:LysR family transcriptional regulator [Pseudomonas sp. KCJK8927]|uniref:LysR family transcriptional regulator n=1 Tax=Pseudomonas sp. KCJK8927 TaxID=3344560 RepID=UPI003906A626
MNRNDLRRADLNLLVVFEMLMNERNVTRVGQKLFLCQPTVSAALGRLRSLFNDPLFIRSGRLMEPTARAEEIYTLLTPALDGIASAMSSSRAFDPATFEGSFHLGMSDDVEYALLPKLIRSLRIEAPNLSLVVRRVDKWQLPQLLLAGEISFGISPANDLPARSHCTEIRSSKPMLLRGDSFATPVDLDAFCNRPHVVISSVGKLLDTTDQILESLGRHRKVVLSIPELCALPSLLAGTDLLALVPNYVAYEMTRTYGIHAQLPPLELPEHKLSMTWREAKHKDPGERWIRNWIIGHLASPYN